jgi:hypothetical protein
LSTILGNKEEQGMLSGNGSRNKALINIPRHDPADDRKLLWVLKLCVFLESLG